VDFLKNLDNKLGITIGKETEEKLLESSMWVWAEREIDSDLRRIINSFKKIMNRGAWVIGPNDSSKKYYKNHMYTNNAKTAYENGILICPLAGWNHYEF
ncbi:MAG: hypothetical protein II740_09945, partial [Lachnospiraceae bacterium]|nr:hypothetical protein [Lachnospiraceae bacterium]